MINKVGMTTFDQTTVSKNIPNLIYFAYDRFKIQPKSAELKVLEA